MEDITRTEIGERTKGVVENEQKQRWVNAVDEHLINGTSEYVGIYSEKEYEQFAEMVGHEKITCDKVIAYVYEATANERLDKTGKRMAFKGQYSITRIQDMIGDLGVNLEFANCFKTSVVVALDSESMVVYDFEVTSWGVVCEACSESDDPDIEDELEANEDTGHGCGHEDDEYIFRYGATITQRTDAETFFKDNNAW